MASGLLEIIFAYTYLVCRLAELGYASALFILSLLMSSTTYGMLKNYSSIRHEILQVTISNIFYVHFFK